MSVYCITSFRSVGCTFFDWTIHFLSGQEKFYNISDSQWITLVNNPVTEINAHGHLKNHPSGFANTQKSINQALAEPQDRLYSIYPIPMQVFDAATNLHMPVDQIGIPENWLLISQYLKNDFDQLFDFCHQNNVKFIYVGDDPGIQLYYLSSRSKGHKMTTRELVGVKETKEERRQVFFSNSIKKWNEIGLTDIWDQREQLALDNRPFHQIDTKFSGLLYPHLWINCQDLWYNGEQSALKMLQYLELELVPNRLAAWRPIYAEWQKQQLQSLEFNFNCDHIVNSIINNWYYEIDLTFDQEVVIQHCLIYQHNLNLKTWQLTKFPNNTQDLHKLLEPNIHSLAPY
jgi:hypothetical protein